MNPKRGKRRIVLLLLGFLVAVIIAVLVTEKIRGGRYQLHSIGIDGKDDAGAEGDITWNFFDPAE